MAWARSKDEPEEKDTSGNVTKAAKEADRRFLNALQAVSNDKASPKSIGKWFQKNKDKVLNGQRFYIPAKAEEHHAKRIFLIQPSDEELASAMPEAPDDELFA